MRIKNPKLWQEYKKYISHSTTVERLAILNGKLYIGSVEEMCKKRKIRPGTGSNRRPRGI
ncbi:hypothetical protein EXS74_00125 [Candidatus Woesearchaeota archaeon]|nr:hypothetical protein [Candidatus Woesearchaeota archaeon]